MYRYHPRVIAALCTGKLKGLINIHETVFERMKLKTANYAPKRLPIEFQSSGSELNTPAVKYSFNDNVSWAEATAHLTRYIFLRKSSYMVMVALVIAMLYLTICTWTGHVDYWGRSGAVGDIADVMDYLTPFMFENFIELSIMQYSLYTLVAAFGVSMFWRYNQYLRRKTLHWAIMIRTIVNDKVK